MPALAAQLVREKVDLIVTTDDATAFAAKRATTTIPVLMAINGDPIVAGLVESIARPGGNITGLMLPQIAGKRLELLRELVPGLQLPDRSPPGYLGPDRWRSASAMARGRRWVSRSSSGAGRASDQLGHSVRVPGMLGRSGTAQASSSVAVRTFDGASPSSR